MDISHQSGGQRAEMSAGTGTPSFIDLYFQLVDLLVISLNSLFPNFFVIDYESVSLTAW